MVTSIYGIRFSLKDKEHMDTGGTGTRAGKPVTLWRRGEDRSYFRASGVMSVQGVYKALKAGRLLVKGAEQPFPYPLFPEEGE